MDDPAPDYLIYRLNYVRNVEGVAPPQQPKAASELIAAEREAWQAIDRSYNYLISDITGDLPDFNDPAVRKKLSQAWWHAITPILSACAEGRMECPREIAARLARLAGIIAKGNIPDLIADAKEASGTLGRHHAGEIERQDKQAAVDYYWACEGGIIDNQKAPATLCKWFGVKRQSIHDWKDELPRKEFFPCDAAALTERAQLAGKRYRREKDRPHRV